MKAVPTRIALVDDHRVVSRSLRAYLESFPDLLVVGTASSGEELLSHLGSWQAEVLIADLLMPGGIDGVETIRRVREAHPSVRVIALTASIDEARMIGALRAGAAGYVRKDAEPELLLEAVRAVAAGKTFLDPAVGAQLARSHMPGTELTAREKDVMRQLALGLSNKQIATALDVSEETVKSHVSSLLAKLDSESRSQAIIQALKRGLISLEELE